MTRILTRVKAGKQRTETQEILTRLQRWISEGVDFCTEIHDRCEENNGYIAGSSQWSKGDVEAQLAKGRPSMPMNRVLQSLNAVANREIMNRYTPKVYGRSRGDEGWATVGNEFLRWQRDQAEAEHEESLAFRSMVASGYSVMHKYWDPLEDEGNGRIVDEEVPIWSMLWDSRAAKQNLVDRRWHVCGKYISRAEAEEEYGDVSPKARKMFKSLALDPDMDLMTKSSAGRWPWQSVSSGTWYNRAEDELFVTEVEWRDVKTIYRAAVPVAFDQFEQFVTQPGAELPMPPGEDGQPWSLTQDQYGGMAEEERAQFRSQLFEQTSLELFDDHATLDEFQSRYFEVTGEDFILFAKQKRYRYRYAVVCNNVLLEEGDRPMGFTYEFLTGFPNATREKTIFFGFVDVAKGPQDWRNTFMSLVLTRLASSPKQTLLVEEGALEDADEFFEQLANPRGAATVPDGFIAGNRFMVLQPPSFPPMERELIAIADQAVNEQAGLSGIDTGQQQDLRRVSGTVVQSVKEASNTILALLFDSLRRYRKRGAKLCLKFMYEFYTPEEVARVVGEENAAGVPDPKNWPDIQRMDIKIDEAPTSVTERLEFFDFLTRTGTLEKWIDQDRIPFSLVLEWFPYITESDRAAIRQHEEETNQLKALQEEHDGLMQFLGASTEGQAQLAQFQGGGGQQPADGQSPGQPSAQEQQPQEQPQAQ